MDHRRDNNHGVRARSAMNHEVARLVSLVVNLEVHVMVGAAGEVWATVEC